MKLTIAGLLIILTIFSSCSGNKLITKREHFFQITKDNGGGGTTYTLHLIKSDSSFKADVIEKSDNLVIRPKEKFIRHEVDVIPIAQEDMSPAKLDLVGEYFFAEANKKWDTFKSVKYYDIKFGLQALSIPFKVRKSIGDDALNPPQVETGLTIGFAPGWKFTRNIYKPSKNYLGKNVSQLSLALGPHFGFGSADLKKASNSPGLLSDRKSAVFTYGLYSMLGFNNINLGFAIGKDYIMGSGKNYWVYQGKTWKGIIIGLDLLKF